MSLKICAAAALIPLTVVAQEAPFMGPGTWEVAAIRNDRLTLTLRLDSVTPRGVTGTISGNPFSNCHDTLPITSSSVESERIVVRSINVEDRHVPRGCDRTLTFVDDDGKIVVTVDNWDGHSRLKVKKRP
jgi:hypothetical protein